MVLKMDHREVREVREEIGCYNFAFLVYLAVI